MSCMACHETKVNVQGVTREKGLKRYQYPGNSHGEWYLDRASCARGRRGDVEKISCAQEVILLMRHTSDGEFNALEPARMRCEVQG
eukprot:1160603-Pelagomonas_calceolata.AAC.2